ncbi:hypothetical protein [Geodermatophilus sp. CPCC 206100]|uniref:hypothetical protein n=1 Tax=Geodermatophilus sp. CPCC 206100 TaxID=3020054 RepID=UPI003B00B706
MSGPSGPEHHSAQGGGPEDQPGWGAPPPPPGYAPAPNWSDAPAGYGAPAGQRPPQVLTAAVLGFVVAFFALIGALGLFALATIFALFAIFGVLYLAIAVMNIWGGVQALSGRGSTVLKTGGLVTAGLALLGLITSLTQGEFSSWSIVLIAAGVGIFFLLNQPASQQYFAARGAR